MKKILTALVAILTISFLFSCNSNNTTAKVVTPVSHEFTFTASCDTAITVKVPVQSPIHMCSGGTSKYTKITGWKDTTIYLHKGQTITLSNEYMNGQGWYWFPAGVTPTMPAASSDDATATSTTKASSSDNSSFSWMPDWLQWSLEKLWQLALLALAAFIVFWLLRELYRAIQRNNTAAAAEGNQPPLAAVANPNIANPIQPIRQEVVVENNTTVVIPESNNVQRPLFVIKNSGQGNVTTGDIHVHVGDGSHKNNPAVKPAEDQK